MIPDDTRPPLDVAERRKIGPYEVIDVVGQGGMGLVLRARNTATGELAAIKLLRGIEPGDVERFRREAHTLGRLQHPGVVRVYSQGVEDGVPWYAMEFIAGVTLDRWWSEQPGDPPSAPSVGLTDRVIRSLRLLRRLCFTLAFIHGEGIVHRDLKPGNIVIRTNDRPVLVDFGLVARFAAPVGREALESGGALVGSVDYMAPEQIRGEFVDARADLYALGCILYEAVTGNPPFAGAPWEVIQQHIGAQPRRPSARVPGIPPQLDDLLLRLLAKDPRSRIGYATDVARELATLASDVSGNDEPTEAAPYLYRPSFVNREAALGQLSACLERANEGHGGFVLIAGESGVGKTRLVMEFTRAANDRGFMVVTGECARVEVEGGAAEFSSSPLHAFGPLLRLVTDHCRLGGLETSERTLGARGKVLASYEPALRGLPGQAEHPEPTALPPQAERQRLVQALGETMAALAREIPLVVVLDDLQWADELSLACLTALPAAAQHSSRLLILGTYRAEEISASLADLSQREEVTRIELGGMADEQLASIVSGMLALEVPPATLGQFVSMESEGNPFFVSEYLRTAVSAGLLHRSGSGEWRVASTTSDADAYRALRLPSTLQELIRRRLLILSAGARLMIEAAAVLGREVEVALAASLADLSESRRLEAVSELLRRQVVEDIDGRHVRFSHDKLREVAYAIIPADRRTLLHRIAGEKIEARGPSGDNLAVLAHHYSTAGIDDKALEYLGKAGEHTLRRGAHTEARVLLARALALNERTQYRVDRRQQAHWLRLLGEAHLGAGDLDGMITHTEESLRTLGLRAPHSPSGWLGLLCAELARRAMRRLLPRREARGGALREVWVEAALGSGQVANAFYYKLQLVRGVTSSLRCVNFSERAGAPSRATLAYGQLGYVAGGARVHWLARRYFERAYALRGSESDASADVVALYFGAMYEMGLGHWQKSEELGEAALQLAERIQNRQEAEVARTVIANTLYYQGRFGEAAERCRTMLESADARSNVQHMGWGLFLIGRSLLASGNVREALEHLERGYTYMQRTDDFVSSLMCQGLLAKALLLSGDATRAREVADSLSLRLPPRPVPLAQCVDGYSALAEVYLALWRRDPAHPGDSTAALAARRACVDLRRFARLFPICAPAALRSSARQQWLVGRRARARRLWAKSVRAASRLAMPYDEARARLHLAYASREVVEQEQHRREALRLLAQLGCTEPNAEGERDGTRP